ncbi:hypothetical protein IM881_06195 [Pectobacterium brasiliense]|uniref:hypothetical protein n=1 Tax=Pectobacterium brasiliense TaxID=180957 RepID=UPI001C623412|nr:hypothetical protein [Pectobacterium brasiliense]MBW5896050.1 hypothetical protein [Pectobacterium brasiliense]
MDVDSIAYASMLVSKESAHWAFWSMIAAIISAVASLITASVTIVAAFVAYSTMNTWKHQEEVKEKKQLKAALVEYRNILAGMPMIMHPDNLERKEFSVLLNDAANKIYLPLVVMEEDLENGDLGKKCNELLRMHYDYLACAETRDTLALHLSSLLEMKIIDLRK